MGIYQKISQEPVTKKALQNVVQGDFFEAYKLFDQAVADLDEKKFNPVPSVIETEIWELGRLDCMATLGKWDGLLQFVKVQIEDNLNHLWSNTVPRLGSHRFPHLRSV